MSLCGCCEEQQNIRQMQLLSSDMSLNLLWSPRQCNNVAHSISKWALAHKNLSDCCCDEGENVRQMALQVAYTGRVDTKTNQIHCPIPGCDFSLPSHSKFYRERPLVFHLSDVHRLLLKEEVVRLKRIESLMDRFPESRCHAMSRRSWVRITLGLVPLSIMVGIVLLLVYRFR